MSRWSKNQRTTSQQQTSSALLNIAKAATDAISYLDMGEDDRSYLLAATSWDSRVRVWEFDPINKSDIPKLLWEDQPLSSVPLLRCCFDSDGKYVYSGNAHGRLYQHPVRRNSGEKLIPLDAVNKEITGLITGLKYIDQIPSGVNGKTKPDGNPDAAAISKCDGKPGLLVGTANHLGSSCILIVDIEAKKIVHCEEIPYSKCIHMDFISDYLYIAATKKHIWKMDLSAGVAKKRELEEIVLKSDEEVSSAITCIGAVPETDGYIAGYITGEVQMKYADGRYYSCSTINRTPLTSTLKEGQIWAVSALATDRDAKLGVTANSKGELIIWNLESTYAELKSGCHAMPITALAAYDGYYAFAHGYDWKGGADEMEKQKNTYKNVSIHIRKLELVEEAEQ